MILYTCYYKGKFFWHKIKKVKGDFIAKENFNIRILILEDETSIQIPVNNRIIKFSKERFYATKEKMSQEAGQEVRTNPR
jgi:hypothetical protein